MEAQELVSWLRAESEKWDESAELWKEGSEEAICDRKTAIRYQNTADLIEQLQKENAELKDELAELELKNHNLIADTYNLKAEAVRDAVDIATRDITPAVSEMEVYIIRKMLDHAARLEGDK